MNEAKSAAPQSLSPAVIELGLEEYVLQLEVDGLAVVPPEVTGLAESTVDEMVALLLARSQELVGCEFSLERGPLQRLAFDHGSVLSTEQGEQSQFLIQQLASYHRLFRDLAINPVAVALMQHLIGRKALRFSSQNAFVKWQGEFGYGKSLGMHVDQTAVPLPWGRRALTANTNWCLTDYTLEGGALAYVPGSHRLCARPSFPQAVQQAVPVVAPKGAVIVFHGATWHGAFPRQKPGMRLSVANYYRHLMITSQEDIQNSFDQSLVGDCRDPELFSRLAGFADTFPYQQQTELLPRVVQ